MFVITESWLDNEPTNIKSLEEEKNMKWNEKILNIPYIDEDIISNNYEKGNLKFIERDKKIISKYLLSSPSTNYISSSRNDKNYNLIYNKMNNIENHLNKHNNFLRSYKKINKTIDKKKENPSIDYITIYLTSIYNNSQHPLHNSLKKIIEKCKNEYKESPNELLYKDMVNLFKNKSTTHQMNNYIESILNNKRHPLNKSLWDAKNGKNIVMNESLNSKNFIPTILLNKTTSIETMTDDEDYLENYDTNIFSNSHNKAPSLVSFAQSIMTTFIEVDDNDIIIGSEVAAEDDIDKDNWNNFHWNGQERPSLKELGFDDVPRSFWNSEIWNSNDYNQSEIIGKNSEVLEYCGANNDDGNDEDISMTVIESINIQDAYTIITESDIIQTLIDELESCCYEIS